MFVFDFFVYFFLFVLGVSFPVVWVVFLGILLGCFGIGVLICVCFGVSVLTSFYLFVGGIMCVCGFFCCFFWGWNFKLFFSPVFFLLVGSGVFVLENFRFVSSSCMEFLFGWEFFQLELFIGVMGLLISLFFVFAFVGQGVGCIRGWEC